MTFLPQGSRAEPRLRLPSRTLRTWTVFLMGTIGISRKTTRGLLAITVVCCGSGLDTRLGVGSWGGALAHPGNSVGAVCPKTLYAANTRKSSTRKRILSIVNDPFSYPCSNTIYKIKDPAM